MKKRLLYVVGFLTLAAVIAFRVWSPSEINLAVEEPPFSSMVLPLKSMGGGVYMDGGSVWVGVMDSNGASYDFVFPYDHKTKGYPTAYHGAIAPNAPGARPLTNPSRAKTIVLHWLRQSGEQDKELKSPYDYLSGQNESIIEIVKRDGLGGIFK